MLDIDELIMPLQQDNWIDLIADIEAAVSRRRSNVTRASFHFHNVYFMDDMTKEYAENKVDNLDLKSIPPYLHMMQHIYRSAKYTKPCEHVKCFHSTDEVLILHNHFPIECLSGECKSLRVPPKMGHLQHYRPDCAKTLKEQCVKEYKSVIVKDNNIWRFKDRLISRTTVVLNDLGFFWSR